MKPSKERDSCFRRNDDLPGFGKIQQSHFPPL
jgi:hypothetical protein